MAVLIDPGEDGLSIEDYTKARLKSLSGNNNIWSVISTIEKKEDSIITRAAPYYEAVQDMGVHYFRFFKKDDKVALIDITVREEADEKYRKAVETILKTAK
ncbi:MAG: hypothetical protein IKG46_11885 [Solobacterium sp.]|nr:hypothetical protein [Solobacterium sp.]